MKNERMNTENGYSAAMSATTGVAVKVNENVTILPANVSRTRRRKWLTTRAPATYDKVAMVSALLGVLIGIGICGTIFIPSVGLYMVALGIFHLLEFMITARYNRRNLGMNSFLLTNGVEYAGAQLFMVLEYVVRWVRRGSPPSVSSSVLVLAFVGLITGQCIRSAAMIQAAESFNHYVQEEKKVNHVLVRSGVYSMVRHPSYFGYYIWVVCSQVLLGNPISLVLFIIVIQVYFTQRLRGEESALVKFFGDDYREYQRQVWSGIPFYK